MRLIGIMGDEAEVSRSSDTLVIGREERKEVLTKAHERRGANTHTMGLTRIPVVFLRASSAGLSYIEEGWGP